MKKYAAIALLSAAQLTAGAAEIDTGMHCDMSAQAFFAPLVQRNLIERKPFRIEKYVSEFRTKSHALKNPSSVTAFGIPVISVFGYADGQIMFHQDPQHQTADVYGAVVLEGIANVQAQLNSMGATKARPVRLDEKRTMIICQGV
jgi:hypothetical protein